MKYLRFTCPETAASAASRLHEAGYHREGRTNTYSNKKSKITIVMKTIAPGPKQAATRKIDGYYENPDNGTLTVVFEDNSEEIIEWRSFCTFMGFPNMEIRENSILLNKTSVKRYCDEKLK